MIPLYPPDSVVHEIGQIDIELRINRTPLQHPESRLRNGAPVSGSDCRNRATLHHSARKALSVHLSHPVQVLQDQQVSRIVKDELIGSEDQVWSAELPSTKDPLSVPANVEIVPSVWTLRTRFGLPPVRHRPKNPPRLFPQTC